MSVSALVWESESRLELGSALGLEPELGLMLVLACQLVSLSAWEWALVLQSVLVLVSVKPIESCQPTSANCTSYSMSSIRSCTRR